MATVHTHANKAIVNRFTSDPSTISFRKLIFFLPRSELGKGQRVASAKSLRCVVATRITIERRSDAVDDNRPPMDRNENGMNATGSVMNAAGK
jgi:hypothetical protein